MKTSVVPIVVLTLCAAGVAHAQTYAGAALTADAVRMSHADSGLGTDPLGSGEAFGFGLRLGTAITDRWGVEVEFVRPAAIESDGPPVAVPLTTSVVPVSPSFTWTSSSLESFLSSLAPTRFDPSALSIAPFTVRAEHRYATLGTSLWVRQEVADRAALVYLGGVAFHRTETEIEYGYNFPRVAGVPIPSPVIFPPITRAFESVTYSVRPMVGVEGRISLTDNVDLAPGVRLHGVPSGWLVRPGVALHWVF